MDEPRILEAGVYDVTRLTLDVREDGVKILQIEIAEPGQSRAFAIAYTVLVPVPATPRDVRMSEARQTCVDYLYTKFGYHQHTEAYIRACEVGEGQMYWIEHMFQDAEGDVHFMREWLIDDYQQFLDALQEAEQ